MDDSRREFIKKALFGLFALLGTGYLAASFKSLTPRAVREQGHVFVPLMPEDEAPRQGVRKKELVHTVSGKERRSRIFVVGSADGIVVLSAVCSHLGCLVNYHKAKKEFLCPCHGGRYDLSGKNIAGPPPAPLARLPHRIENGMVMVGIKV